MCPKVTKRGIDALHLLIAFHISIISTKISGYTSCPGKEKGQSPDMLVELNVKKNLRCRAPKDKTNIYVLGLYAVNHFKASLSPLRVNRGHLYSSSPRCHHHNTAKQ